MQAITQSSAHAIRVLTFLAQRPAGEFQLVRVLAEVLELPAPYLAKILQPLANRGLLESQRGRGGGFRLARAPEEISLRQIVDALERLGGPRECLLGQAECSDDRACPLHDFWRRANDGFHARLAATHLSDLAEFCRRAPESGYPFRSPEGRPSRGGPARGRAGGAPAAGPGSTGAPEPRAGRARGRETPAVSRGGGAASRKTGNGRGTARSSRPERGER